MSMYSFNEVQESLAKALNVTFHAVVEDDGVETVPFSHHWENGTGYFDGLSKTVVTTDACGRRLFKSVDTMGRPIVLVRNCGRQFVIFQRYSDNQQLLVVHESRHVRGDFMRMEPVSNTANPNGSAFTALDFLEDGWRDQTRRRIRAATV